MYEFLKLDKSWLVYWGPPPSTRLTGPASPHATGQPSETAPAQVPAKLNRLLEGAAGTVSQK